MTMTPIQPMQFGEITYRQACRLKDGNRLESGSKRYRIVNTPEIIDRGDYHQFNFLLLPETKDKPVIYNRSYAYTFTKGSAIFWHKGSEPVKKRKVSADVDKTWTVVA